MDNVFILVGPSLVHPGVPSSAPPGIMNDLVVTDRWRELEVANELKTGFPLQVSRFLLIRIDKGLKI